MKSIERAIMAYNNNQISLDELQSFLSFKDWDSLNKQEHHNKKIMNRILVKVSSSNASFVPSPEDSFIAHEFANGFDDLLNVFRKLCSKRDFEIYTDFFVFGIKQAVLAERFSLSRSAISMIILRVNVRIRKYLSRHPELQSAFRDYLLSEIDK